MRGFPSLPADPAGESMPKSNFGARQEPPGRAAQTAGRLEIVSKIEFVRAALAILIREHDVASAFDRDSLFMRIRLVQDQVAALKHRNPAQAQRPSSLAWTDRWNPD
jgi:hypothetical protein